MLGFILTLAIVGAVIWYVIKDMNEPLADKMSAGTKKVSTEPKNVLVNIADLNNDGKVNVADAKEALIETKAVAKKVQKKVAEKVKKTTGRKKKSS